MEAAVAPIGPGRARVPPKGGQAASDCIKLDQSGKDRSRNVYFTRI